MKALVVLSFVVVTAHGAMISLHGHLDFQWDAWKNEFGKMYYDEKEEAVRRDIWERNLHFVDLHNYEVRQGKHAFTVTMNKFADLTSQEFVKMFLGKVYSPNSAAYNNTSIYVSNNNFGSLPETVDWRRQGYVTPVKNQGECGSGWAFSTTGSLEGTHFKATGKLVSLSEQNLMDCSRPEGDSSCEGGLMDKAFEYVIKNGGIDTETSYNYEAKDRNNCKYTKMNRGATISSYVDITPHGYENALKKGVATVGPISVSIDASQPSFQLYQKGVYSDPSCSSTKLDHRVLIVGYGSEGGKDYWIVKNSWGTNWGMDGYIKMSRNNNNNCGVATRASYPVV